MEVVDTLIVNLSGRDMFRFTPAHQHVQWWPKSCHITYGRRKWSSQCAPYTAASYGGTEVITSAPIVKMWFHCTSWQLLSFKLNCVFVSLDDLLLTTLAIKVFSSSLSLYDTFMKYKRLPHLPLLTTRGRRISLQTKLVVRMSFPLVNSLEIVVSLTSA